MRPPSAGSAAPRSARGRARCARPAAPRALPPRRPTGAPPAPDQAHAARSELSMHVKQWTLDSAMDAMDADDGRQWRDK